jgi:uncharacterized protein
VSEIIVDMNAWLGSWPFQYFQDETAADLVRRLAAEGITHAAVGNPEAAFSPDCLGTNERLLERVAGRPSLLPVLAVDPTKGDAPDILALAVKRKVRALRVFPGYHCYELSSPAAVSLIEKIAALCTVVLVVQVRMEDERTHHPLCKIPPVSIESIVETARRFPSLQVVAACPYYWEAMDLVRGPANLAFEISHVETLRTLLSLSQQAPADRILFGTHVPFLQSMATLMKLRAPYVPADLRLAVASANATRVLGALARPSVTRKKAATRPRKGR